MTKCGNTPIAFFIKLLISGASYWCKRCSVRLKATAGEEQLWLKPQIASSPFPSCQSHDCWLFPPGMTSRLCNFACYSIRRFNPFWRSCMSVSRRDFLTGAVVGSLSLGSQGQDRKEREPTSPPAAQAGGKRPIIVCAGNGYDYLGDAYKFVSSGGDTLDAALRVVKGPEDDPKDDSVGLGGLPNEEGVVELDACCMRGPTRRAGSVGGVRNIKNVSLVTKAVMEHTGHVML